MKFIFSLFIIMSTTKECNKNADSKSLDSTDNIEKPSETIQLPDNITLQYKAISRGTYYDAVITSETVSIQKDRNSEVISKNCNKNSWSNLINVLNRVELKNISNLKAPTEARFYDGAATAQLIIKKDSTAFESNSFDHGTPPKEIEALVKEILSMAKNIE